MYKHICTLDTRPAASHYLMLQNSSPLTRIARIYKSLHALVAGSLSQRGLLDSRFLVDKLGEYVLLCLLSFLCACNEAKFKKETNLIDGP